MKVSSRAVRQAMFWSAYLAFLLVFVGQTCSSQASLGVTLSTERIGRNNQIPMTAALGLHDGLVVTPWSVDVDKRVSRTLSAWTPFVDPLVAEIATVDCAAVDFGNVSLNISERSTETGALSDGLLIFICDSSCSPSNTHDSHSLYPVTIVLDERKTQTVSLSVNAKERILGPVTICASLSLNRHIGTHYSHLDAVGSISKAEVDGETLTSYAGTMRKMFADPSIHSNLNQLGDGWSADLELRFESRNQTPLIGWTSLIAGYRAYIRARDLGYRMVWHGIRTEISSINTRVESIGPDGFIYVSPAARITGHVSSIVEARQPTLEGGLSIRLRYGIELTLEQLSSELEKDAATVRAALSVNLSRDRYAAVAYDTEVGVWSAVVSLDCLSLSVLVENIDLARSRILGASLRFRQSYAPLE